MTGGNQVRLVEELQKAKVVDALRARFQKGAVVGGTSAGAAAASAVMIGGYLGRRDTPKDGDRSSCQALDSGPRRSSINTSISAIAHSASSPRSPITLRWSASGSMSRRPSSSRGIA
jgi:cyanophycinase-like exopeptidase